MATATEPVTDCPPLGAGEQPPPGVARHLAPSPAPAAGLVLRAGRGATPDAAPRHPPRGPSMRSTGPDRARHPGLRRAPWRPRSCGSGATPRRPARPGPVTTSWPTRSRASPWASAAWSRRSSRPACSTRSRRVGAATAKVLMGAAVAASAATTVADVVRRRARAGRPARRRHPPAADPRAPRTGPDAVPHLRDAPARPGGSPVPPRRRRRLDRADRRDDLVGADERHPAVRRSPSGTSAPAWPPTRSRSSAGTPSTTGTTGSTTRAAGCGRCTSCTTPASATTSRRRCASRWPRA